MPSASPDDPRQQAPPPTDESQRLPQRKKFHDWKTELRELLGIALHGWGLMDHIRFDAAVSACELCLEEIKRIAESEEDEKLLNEAENIMEDIDAIQIPRGNIRQASNMSQLATAVEYDVPSEDASSNTIPISHLQFLLQREDEKNAGFALRRVKRHLVRLVRELVARNILDYETKMPDLKLEVSGEDDDEVGDEYGEDEGQW